jgi:hypothetical protein
LATEANLFDLLLSPNPSVDHLDIKARFANTDNADLEIFKVNGVKVYNKNLSLNDNVIDHRVNTQSYPAGTYIVKVKTKEGEQVKRFIISK